MNKQIFYTLSIAIFFCLQSIVGQVGGEKVYQFLNISTSARQTALGGKALTLFDDVNQGIWNPSAINEELDGNLGVNYTSYLTGIQIGSISYAKQFSQNSGTFNFNAHYLNYGSLIGADENGMETGSFNASDIAIAVGYSRALPWENIYAGAAIKLISSTISSYNSIGIAADFAISYYNPRNPFTLSFVIRNLGTQITSYSGVSEQLPLEILLGGSYQLENVPIKWFVTIDNLQQWDVSVSNPSNQTTDIDGNITEEKISFFTNALRHFIVGVELFSESAINVRLGYNFRRASELQLQNVRAFGGISFGLGIKMNTFAFNYSFSKVHAESNVSTFSLQINLDRNR